MEVWRLCSTQPQILWLHDIVCNPNLNIHCITICTFHIWCSSGVFARRCKKKNSQAALEIYKRSWCCNLEKFRCIFCFITFNADAQQAHWSLWSVHGYMCLVTGLFTFIASSLQGCELLDRQARVCFTRCRGNVGSISGTMSKGLERGAQPSNHDTIDTFGLPLRQPRLCLVCSLICDTE